jgi:hypothetical protein
MKIWADVPQGQRATEQPPDDERCEAAVAFTFWRGDDSEVSSWTRCPNKQYGGNLIVWHTSVDRLHAYDPGVTFERVRRIKS